MSGYAWKIILIHVDVIIRQIISEYWFRAINQIFGNRFACPSAGNADFQRFFTIVVFIVFFFLQETN